MTDTQITVLSLSIINILIACGISHFFKKSLLKYINEANVKLEDIKSKLTMNNFVSQKEYDLEQSSYKSIWLKTTKMRSSILNFENSEITYAEKRSQITSSINDFINEYDSLTPFIDESIIKLCDEYENSILNLVSGLIPAKDNNWDNKKVQDQWMKHIRKLKPELIALEKNEESLLIGIRKRMKSIS
ncbi:MAG: hypothetical protein JKY89_03690 [Immundisolibacteraceae bacterium]|nr:hypothetical protein [Immundisolibacteraceae bacterium]